MANPCPELPQVINLKEHPDYPRHSFVSPLTRQQEIKMNWTIINPNWRGYDNPSSLTEKELEMLRKLEALRMASSFQLSRDYYSERTRKNAKNRIKKLSKNGIFVAHYLETERLGTVPILTLGPGGARIINAPFIPNWWKNISAQEVLTTLVLHKLYSRIAALDKDAVYLPAPPPYNAVIETKGISFVVTAAYKGNVSTDLMWAKDIRLVIVCENPEEIISIARMIKNPSARYITDYELFYIPLSEAFINYDEKTDTLQFTEVKMFKVPAEGSENA